MRALTLFAALLSATLAHAQTYAFRGGPGVQMTTGASRPTTIAGRRTLWVDSSNRLRFYNGTDDTYPATIAATTKGDLSAFTGSAWARLAAGSNGLCLVTDSGESTGLKWAACAASTGYQTVQDEATPLTQRTTINFTGAGVSCVDNAGSSRTDCTIAGGGSSTLAATYSNGASQTDSTIGLDSTRLGVRIRDNATPIAGALLAVQNSSGASTYFSISTSQITAGTKLAPAGDNTDYLGDSTHHWSGLYATQVYNAGGSLVLGSTSSYVRLAPVSGSYASVRLDGSDIWQTYTDRMLWTPNAAASGAKVALTLTGAANTGQTASTEVPDVDLALNRTVQWSTGAITAQRAVLVRAPTYGFVGASTISDAATVAVTGAPAAGANGTITRSWSLWSQDGAALLQRDGVGATVGTLGLLVQNRTAATSGNQKYSPTIALEGYGWKTNATAASQSVRYELQTIPIQGAAAPTGELRISESINGGAETTLLQIGSSSITASVPVLPGFTSTTVAPSWSTVSYQNSWVDYSGSLTTRYTKDAQGIVTLLIAMKTGSNGTVSFNMPAGYRPSQTVIQTGSTLAGAIAICELATSGDLTTDVSSTSGTFFRLTYYAEN